METLTQHFFFSYTINVFDCFRTNGTKVGPVQKFLMLGYAACMLQDALSPDDLIGVNFSSFHKILVFRAEIHSCKSDLS